MKRYIRSSKDASDAYKSNALTQIDNINLKISDVSKAIDQLVEASENAQFLSNTDRQTIVAAIDNVSSTIGVDLLDKLTQYKHTLEASD